MEKAILGGIYGAIIGDAVGVPYEFIPPNSIPDWDEIDIIPPAGFTRAWPQIKPGTYSDDGAQLLHVANNIANNKLTAHDLHDSLVSWYKTGEFAVDNRVFDIGGQTIAALSMSVEEVVKSFGKNKHCNGNGSLMRTLPVSFIRNRHDIIPLSIELSKATHPHPWSLVCCVVYNLIARDLVTGISLDDAIANSWHEAREYVPMELVDVVYDVENYAAASVGSGFVVNSLWSAIDAVQQSSTYEEAVKNAIKFGNDTDTTACIAGGLAGIIYGFENLPTKWVVGLRNRSQINEVINLLRKSQ